MTDAHMTPTNDAPVTVEQEAQSLEALSDWLLANDHDMKLPDSVAHDPRDIAATLRRLAALASAPAGDGVEVQRDAMAEFETWWSDHKAGGGEWVKRAAFVAGWAAALARPRAAVGEQVAKLADIIEGNLQMVLCELGHVLKDPAGGYYAEVQDLINSVEALDRLAL